MSIIIWVLLIIVAAYMAFVASMLIARGERSRLTNDLINAQSERTSLQRELDTYSATIDANDTDMAQMRDKIASHADEIMQLRCANGKLVATNQVSHQRVVTALDGLDRIDSIRITTLQQITGTE